MTSATVGPSLLHRLVFDKEVLKNEYGVLDALPLPKAHSGGGEEAGDGDGEAPQASAATKNIRYGQRMGLYFLLVVMSILLSLFIFRMKVFQKAVFKNMTITDIGEGIDDDLVRTQKYKNRLFFYLLLFLSVFLAVFLGLWIVGCFVFILIGLINQDEPFKVAKKVWKHIFINFDGIPIGLNFWLVFFLIVIVLSIHYLGYSTFFNGWYEDMYFQDVGKRREDTQLDSFIHYYSLTILVLFTFFMILLCLKTMMQPGETQLYGFYTMFAFLIYLCIAMYVIKQYKMGRYKRMLFILILVFMVVFLYMFVIVLIVSIMSTKSPSPLKAMFGKGSGIFVNMILRWGIDASAVIPAKKKAAKAEAD